MRRVEGGGKTARGGLLAVFDFAERWFQQSNFYGCLFINTIGEYSAPDTPIRQICKDYKEMVKGTSIRFVNKRNVRSTRVCRGIGVIIGRSDRDRPGLSNPKTAKIAKRAAKALIEKALT